MGPGISGKEEPGVEKILDYCSWADVFTQVWASGCLSLLTNYYRFHVTSDISSLKYHSGNLL